MTTVDVTISPGTPQFRCVEVPAAAEIVAWPVTVPLPQAGRCWGLGRDASYELARRGEFPVPVLRVGRRLVVSRGSVLTALGIDE